MKNIHELLKIYENNLKLIKKTTVLQQKIVVKLLQDIAKYENNKELQEELQNITEFNYDLYSGFMFKDLEKFIK